MSDEIELITASNRRGFGSVRVRVTVGATTWSTSIFPDKKSEAYVLPVKALVRRTEALEVGRQVPVSFVLADY